MIILFRKYLTSKCLAIFYFFYFVHDIHALDSKGRCWSVKQSVRLDSLEIQPLFPGFISKEGKLWDCDNNFIPSKDFKIRGLLDEIALVLRGLYTPGCWHHLLLLFVQWLLKNILPFARNGVCIAGQCGRFCFSLHVSVTSCLAK